MAERVETSWQYGGYGRSYSKGGYPGGGGVGISSTYTSAQGSNGYRGQYGGGGGVAAGPASRGSQMAKKFDQYDGSRRRWSGIPAELGRHGAWRIVWCHEKCHKPQNAPRRVAMEAAVRKHGGQLVNIKKARMLGTWISRGRAAKPPFALVTDWREAQPCARELELDMNKVNVPKIMIIVCTSSRQAKKAQAWANGETFEEDKDEDKDDGSIEGAGDAGGFEMPRAADQGDAPEESSPKEPAAKPPDGIKLHIVEWSKIPQELLGGVLNQMFAAGDAAMKVNGNPSTEPTTTGALKAGAVDMQGDLAPTPPAPAALPLPSLQLKAQFMQSQVSQQFAQSSDAQTTLSRQAMMSGTMRLSPPGLCRPTEVFDQAMSTGPTVAPPCLGGSKTLEKVAFNASFDRMSNVSIFHDHSPGRSSTTFEPDVGGGSFSHSVMTEDAPLMYYSF